MRQAEHVGDEPIVFIERHHHLLHHGGGEQFARRRGGLGRTRLDEDHVPAREQFRVRAEHRMQRSHAAAVRLERVEPGAQRRLERADVEDHALGTAHGQLAQDLVGDAERRGDDDEIVVERRSPPVGEGARTPAARRSGSAISTAKPCDAMNSANQRPILPAPPMTSAVRPFPAPWAATLACSWVVSEERISRRRMFSATCGRHAVLLARLARRQQHFALAVVVARGMAGGAFGANDFAAGLLAFADQLEDLTVEFVDPAAQVVERAHESPCKT